MQRPARPGFADPVTKGVVGVTGQRAAAAVDLHQALVRGVQVIDRPAEHIPDRRFKLCLRAVDCAAGVAPEVVELLAGRWAAHHRPQQLLAARIVPVIRCAAARAGLLGTVTDRIVLVALVLQRIGMAQSD